MAVHRTFLRSFVSRQFLSRTQLTQTFLFLTASHIVSDLDRFVFLTLQVQIFLQIYGRDLVTTVLRPTDKHEMNDFGTTYSTAME